MPVVTGGKLQTLAWTSHLHSSFTSLFYPVYFSMAGYLFVSCRPGKGSSLCLSSRTPIPGSITSRSGSFPESQ
ncbi:hypothetical protein K431DRAFT_41341 [Polychaeton citri CBS 116435]|uniref:Uncharacterized protein n=1 Tax=Polychaeton citri CBS 116435 TaxID=1314669 RepID=A0A9P4QCW1_9PEZI|nr:hypothetical protein K431DRAFT_41341 [Polychaeton citri CBS 116435]